MSHESGIKLLSEIGRYELINVNDGEKYDYLQNNDLVIDDEGNIKFLIINVSGGKLGFLGGSKEFLEIPWECVKKIGARTIILDAEENDIKKATI
ncbi:YlmC/YmxH family sporulation protein [Clostridium sp. SHJSY1]|uniref:YlmC/YmxH family sporulation protein n=1 Tax=Clostridium sp. SHJSY1 TaxID=2942483 RepID=UPI002876B703|nr:YlmC/YmxH family sporulation protein [Clostridium sp. SHJSY1]MDS0524879.1 YlmC/YmxH family sporulation protein [Clostridium sp. SHJSY1]